MSFFSELIGLCQAACMCQWLTSPRTFALSLLRLYLKPWLFAANLFIPWGTLYMVRDLGKSLR